MTLIGLLVRFPLPETPEGIEPGAVGTIIEEGPSSPNPDTRVRVRIGDYESPWITPGGLEFMPTLEEAQAIRGAVWYVEKLVGGDVEWSGRLTRFDDVVALVREVKASGHEVRVRVIAPYYASLAELALPESLEAHIEWGVWKASKRGT
jgi:hypothetical protein